MMVFVHHYVVYSCIVCVSFVSCMYSSKSLEGYPAGLLADYLVDPSKSAFVYVDSCEFDPLDVKGSISTTLVIPALVSVLGPGDDREAVITKKTLKYLTFSVIGDGANSKYNYYQMKQMVRDPNIEFKKRTLLYVGGYLDSPNFLLAKMISRLYKNKGYNVFLLDTNRFTTMEYPVAVRYMRTVGKRTAEMLANLTKEGLNPKKLEVIGLSLGGQTVSFIAKNYRQLTGMNISRITGLDPSGPCFRNLGPDERLDQTDADFVDVVGTNIDGFGMAAPVGHVNFYVNGGEFQPGDIFWVPCNVLCSHVRSYTLWLAALQYPTSFIAIQCDSVQDARDKRCYGRKPMVTNLLGPYTDRKKPGIFFLATQNNFPYYLGENGLKEEYEYFHAHMKEITDNDPMKI